MNRRRSRVILVLLVMSLGVGLWWRRGADPSPTPLPATTAESAAMTSDQAAVPNPGWPKSEVGERSANAEPIKLRPPQEIRESLEAQAREIVAKGLGGVEEADKQALAASLHEFEEIRAGGLSDSHPVMLLGLAKFSRKIDRLSAYDEAEWKADAAAFLEKRLSQLDALPEDGSLADLRERWWREFARDDLPEAILFRYFQSIQTREALRSGIQRLIGTMRAASE